MIVRRILAAAIIVALGGFGYYKLFEGKRQFEAVAATLPRKIAEAQTAAVPTGPAALRPDPPVPDEENAAPLYEKAVQKWLAIDEHERMQIASRFSSLEPQENLEKLEALEKDLRNQREILALLDAATSRPRCIFPLPYEQGAAMKPKLYGPMKSFAGILSGRGLLLWQRADYEAAAEAFRAAGRHAAHVADTPLLVGMLVSLASNGINIRQLEKAASHSESDNSALARLEIVAQSLSPLPDFRRALDAEAVLAQQTVTTSTLPQVVKMIDPDGGRMPLHMELLTIPLGVDDDLQKRAFAARNLELWAKVYRRIEGMKDPLAIGPTIDVIVRDETDYQKDRTRIMNAIFFFDFSQATDAIVAAQVRRDLLRAKIAIFRYKNHTGAYPKSADRLPTLPIDPFTNKPLRYKFMGDGFQIYSVGSDLRDDGGVRPKDLLMEHPMRPQAPPAQRG